MLRHQEGLQGLREKVERSFDEALADRSGEGAEQGSEHEPRPGRKRLEVAGCGACDHLNILNISLIYP